MTACLERGSHGRCLKIQGKQDVPIADSSFRVTLSRCCPTLELDAVTLLLYGLVDMLSLSCLQEVFTMLPFTGFT